MYIYIYICIYDAGPYFDAETESASVLGSSGLCRNARYGLMYICINVYILL